jgi:uncharacterized radical SAM protein YgiQ
MKTFLPISKSDLKKRGWKHLDVVIITGDAYVDHPSYGAAVIGRVLEKNGFKVGIISQPDWKDTKDFEKLGKPKLFFGITAGNVDSMIANYTANKKPRKEDDYSPVKDGLGRPDRATIVYANKVREAFGDVPIVIGGLEASMRRLAHYDYWSNSVRRSLLLDARADLLVYGMGETQLLEIGKRLKKGELISSLDNIRGTAVVRKEVKTFKDTISVPGFEIIKEDKAKFTSAFKLAHANQNPFTAHTLIQKHGNRYVVVFPPPLPLKQKELDNIYELPYTRDSHPVYKKSGAVKGLETVKFSMISHRGCCGECSFCSLYFHQGRIVQSRSPASLIREAKTLSKMPDFKGTITDIGGPTANMYLSDCKHWKEKGGCENKSCLFPEKCKNFKTGYSESIRLYKKIRSLPEINHLFIASGFRHDLLCDADAEKYLEEICRHHISGQLKVAPEHMFDNILELMNKPSAKTYDRFLGRFSRVNSKLDKKCYLVNYFISSFPGSGPRDALGFGLNLLKRRMHPEQVQDFIPLPMTSASCMYYTGEHPFTGKSLYVSKNIAERKTQRALLQSKNKANRSLIIKALKDLKAENQLKTFFPRKK